MSILSRAKRTGDPFLFYMWIVGGLIAVSILCIAIEYIWGSGYILKNLTSVLTLSMDEDDSWGPMLEAAYARYNRVEGGIYQFIFFEEGIKFQYPPISILPYFLALKVGFGYDTLFELSCALSLFSMFCMAYCGYVISVIILEKYSEDGSLLINRKIALFFVSVLGVFTFYPIWIGQYIGQIQVILDFLITFAFMAWLFNWKHLSGGAIAVVALFKPQIAVILLWALFRKQKKLVIGMMIVFVPAGIVSLVVFGFQEHVEYLKVISHMGRRGEVIWANQSVGGILHRLFTDADPLVFHAKSFAPFNMFVYVTTLVSSALLLLFGLLFYKPIGEASLKSWDRLVYSALDLATMMFLLTIATPIAWGHHYGILWPGISIAILVAIHFLVEKRSWSGVTLVVLCGSYFLISNHFIFLHTKQFSGVPINLIQSYNFLGGILLLIGLLFLRNFYLKASKVEEVGVRSH